MIFFNVFLCIINIYKKYIFIICFQCIINIFSMYLVRRFLMYFNFFQCIFNVYLYLNVLSMYYENKCILNVVFFNVFLCIINVYKKYILIIFFQCIINVFLMYLVRGLSMYFNFFSMYFQCIFVFQCIFNVL